MANPDDTYRAALPMPDMTRWLAGADTPSLGTFLKVIDILLEDSRGPDVRATKKD